MVIIVTILIALGIAWAMAKPHFFGAAEAENVGISLPNTPASSDLQDKKGRILQTLKDLELDFATDKLTAQEYEQLKQKMRAELADVITTLEQHTTR